MKSQAAPDVCVFTTTGEIQSDWIRLPESAPIPGDGRVIVGLDRFLDDIAGTSIDVAERIAVTVDAGEDVTRLRDHLDSISLILLNFPTFADGRAFSSARLLRERHGYSGDLRAKGDVLIDQIPHMLRCGFTSFEVTHEPTRRRLFEGVSLGDAAVEVPNYYQPAGDVTEPVAGRSWARRRISQHE